MGEVAITIAARREVTAMPMLVSCVPGTRGEYVSEALHQVLNELRNLSATPRPAKQARSWVGAYLLWASGAAQRLGPVISSEDIDRLVLTRRYELILSNIGTAGDPSMDYVFSGLLSVEIGQRVGALTSAVEWLDDHLRLWEPIGSIVALDSSFVCHAEKPLEEIDFPNLLDLREQAILVTVSSVVVDELDRLKEIKGNDHVRWRARHALAVLDDRCEDTTGPAVLHPADASAPQTGGIPRGPVLIEILADPPRHTRLPIDDDEIVERVRSWEPLAPNGNITLLTYDTGQATRARQAGLAVRKFDKPRVERTGSDSAKPAGKTGSTAR